MRDFLGEVATFNYYGASFQTLHMFCMNDIKLKKIKTENILLES